MTNSASKQSNQSTLFDHGQEKHFAEKGFMTVTSTLDLPFNLKKMLRVSRAYLGLFKLKNISLKLECQNQDVSFQNCFRCVFSEIVWEKWILE